MKYLFLFALVLGAIFCDTEPDMLEPGKEEAHTLSNGENLMFAENAKPVNEFTIKVDKTKVLPKVFTFGCDSANEESKVEECKKKKTELKTEQKEDGDKKVLTGSVDVSEKFTVLDLEVALEDDAQEEVLVMVKQNDRPAPAAGEFLSIGLLLALFAFIF